MQSSNRKTKIDLPQIKKKQILKNDDRESDTFDLLFKGNKREVDLIDLRKGKRHKGYRRYFGILVVLLIPACFFVVQIVTGGNEIDQYKAITETVTNEESKNIKTANNSVVEDDIPDVQFASPSPPKAQLPRNENKQAVVVNKKPETHRAIAVVKAAPKPIVIPNVKNKLTYHVIPRSEATWESPKRQEIATPHFVRLAMTGSGRLISTNGIKPVKKSVPAVVNIRKNIPAKKIQVAKINTQVVNSTAKVNQAISDIMLRPLSVVSNSEQKHGELTLRGVH